jgi:hypothetical protein
VGFFWGFFRLSDYGYLFWGLFCVVGIDDFYLNVLKRHTMVIFSPHGNGCREVKYVAS